MNINQPDWDQRREHDGFRALRAKLADREDSEHTGLSLWEVEPGQKAYPYHWHVGEEEWIVVTVGAPTLRTPEGTRTLAEGEIVFFPTGEQGAHQLINETEEPMRFLSFSNLVAAEACFYPDSGKVGLFEDRRGGTVREIFRTADTVDYYEGE
ncbi:MAG: cupin domain-containing protein [Thermoleophilaceae bacterium]|nr:cupin domain-containing protein [Thermoleophilaceae bacterium]